MVHLLLLRELWGTARFLGILSAPWSLVYMGGIPSCVQDSGYEGVPIAGHALWAEVGGSTICVVCTKVRLMYSG